jgi:hypothetical protein
MRYPTKCMSRATPMISVSSGNHSVSGIPGDERHTDEVTCMHAPLRARSMLTTKIDQGRRVEEAGFTPGEAWHSRRWWRLAREGGLDDEWAACSYQDGSLTVRSRKRPLGGRRSTRQHGGRVGPPRGGERVGFLHELDPDVGAYLLALSTVPGSFSETDFRLITELNRLQRQQRVKGDLLEIGAYHGRSAILLGYLAGRDERLVVSDLFNESAETTRDNREENQRRYPGFGRAEFEQQYQRFHHNLPELLVGSSTEIDRAALARRFRFVHVDGSHQYDIMRQDFGAGDLGGRAWRPP